MTKIVGGNEVKLDVSKLEFEERYDSDYLGITTLYFTGPKDLISDKYPEAESATVMIEFTTDNPYAFYPTIMISPTKDGRDYDWWYLYIDESDTVIKLIDIGLSRGEEKKNERTL